MCCTRNSLSCIPGQPARWLAAWAFGLCLTGAAWAQPVAPPAGGGGVTAAPALVPDVETADAELYSGVVVRAGEGRITVTNPQGDRLTQRVTPQTKILRNKKPADLASLQPGDSVRVVTSKLNPLVALTIAATPGQPGAKVPPAAPQSDISPALQSQPEPAVPPATASPAAVPPAAEPPAIAPVPAAPAWLGVMLRPGTRGVVVSRVHPAGPASVSGVNEMDVITQVDGHLIRQPEDIALMLKGRQPGDHVILTVLRGALTRDIDVALQTPPAAVPPAATPVAGPVDRPLPPLAPPPTDEAVPVNTTIPALIRQAEENNRLLQQLMNEVRSLREDVNTLKAGATPVSRTE